MKILSETLVPFGTNNLKARRCYSDARMLRYFEAEDDNNHPLIEIKESTLERWFEFDIYMMGVEYALECIEVIALHAEKSANEDPDYFQIDVW